MTQHTQPEALRLVDALEVGSYLLSVERYATAAELRRLHEVNTELLDALQELFVSEYANSLEIVGKDTDGHPLNASGVARKKARAAIAKATGNGSL